MSFCKGVVLQLQGITIIEDFLPLHLGSTDVILGLKWLATFGETRDDWRKLTLSFELGGKTVILQGDPNLTKARVSLKTMVKELQQEKMRLMVELYQLTVNNENSENVTLEVQQILCEFQDVFAQPTSLSPFRGYDHAIVLKEGAEPVNMRPYM